MVRLLLDEREVHLWLVDADDPRLDAHFPAWRQLLDAGERARLERFVVEHARRECLITRALVRLLLSRYAAPPPRAWRFTANAHGRPAIAWPELAPPLCFNLAHTPGMIVALLGRHQAIGVDVEDTSRRRRTVEIADRFFSAVEVEDLFALDAAAQRDRFFDYWTLKEAYIKARGMGLALPLHRFSFHLADDPDRQPIRASFAPPLDDDPRAWHFELHSPSERHRLALAVREPRVVVRWHRAAFTGGRLENDRG